MNVELTIQANLKLENTFLYFSVAIDPGEILSSLWQEEGNFEALKRCYIHVYLTGVMEKLLIFNIRET